MHIASQKGALSSAIVDDPRIRVIIRKRPLTSKEIQKGEADILDVYEDAASIKVNEPKCRVDLTKYIESHTFKFDGCLGEQTGNDAVYQITVRPLIDTILGGGYATCFAYGQTGSGKTFTMQPLPVRAAADILTALTDSQFASVNLFVSCFEIYGGKVYDLLNGRKRLEVREDGRKKVCIVGLKDFKVMEVQAVEHYIHHSNSARSTGSTGANADSSRSHSIMQFSLRTHVKLGRETDKMLQDHGKLSFIDLAGSERGADTSDTNRQTRLEGAEINKSLLALKECIRALDSVARHVPFRGSKLTEVLRDSFLGASGRTVMIANVSPSSASCEHTLNTLRYANRVKELRKESVAFGQEEEITELSIARPRNRVNAGQTLEVSEATDAPPMMGSDAISISREQEDPEQQSFAKVDKTRGQLEQSTSDREMQEGLQILVGHHRRQIEKDMAIVRQEMELLTQMADANHSPEAYIQKLLEVIGKKAQGVQLLAKQAELCSQISGHSGA